MGKDGVGMKERTRALQGRTKARMERTEERVSQAGFN